MGRRLFIIRAFYAAWHASGVLIKTKIAWPLKTWLRFWLTNEPEKIIEINGAKFAVRGHALAAKLIDMYVILENAFDKAYLEKMEFAKAAPTILDVGSHIGAFAVCASPYVKNGTIYAFEPFFGNYEFLEKNIELNKLRNVIPMNMAVASDNNGRTLYLAKMNTSAHSLTKKSDNFVKVSSISLEQFFREKNIENCDFLKMDCEGAEYDILISASGETLKKIKQISMEYHLPQFFGAGSPDLFPKLISHLKDAGFEVSVKKENYQRGYVYAKQKV